MGDTDDNELLRVREALAALRVRLAALGEDGLPGAPDDEWGLLAIEGDALALALLAQQLRTTPRDRQQPGTFGSRLAPWRRAPGMS